MREAAEKTGLSGDAADAYAKSVVIEDLKEAGDEDVFRKVFADLAEKSAGVADDELRRRMQEFLSEAKTKLVSEAGSGPVRALSVLMETGRTLIPLVFTQFPGHQMNPFGSKLL